jgi:uncharacterized surface protein with fasciclin (FAS1) repeats
LSSFLPPIQRLGSFPREITAQSARWCNRGNNTAFQREPFAHRRRILPDATVSIAKKETKENTMLRTTVISLTAAAALATSAFASDKQDIVDTAAAAGDFSTLLAAAEAAGLVETLKGDGPFTVFAPTDAAFAALPEGTVDDLLLPENQEMLASILTYHVIPGKIMSTDLSDDMEAETVNGDTVMIDLDNGVMVDNATVTTADIEASNGVIHVIDAVIMPNS